MVLRTRAARSVSVGASFVGGGFSFGSSSAHPGGCNVMMGDGSVKFVKSTINRQTWWSLGTKAGGEVISADSY